MLANGILLQEEAKIQQGQKLWQLQERRKDKHKSIFQRNVHVIVVTCAHNSTWRRTRFQDTAPDNFIS